jgi:hypothetical protein
LGLTVPADGYSMSPCRNSAEKTTMLDRRIGAAVSRAVVAASRAHKIWFCVVVGVPDLSTSALKMEEPAALDQWYGNHG